MHNETCRKDIPYPSVSNESVPSLIQNLVNALYGTNVTKSVVNRQVIWNVPCDPNNTSQITGLPRNTGEGLLCYIIRAFNSNGIVNLANIRNFANDAAAAAANPPVPVGGIYRNGSVVQIRIA
jgi:hypothetical protein